MKSLLKIYGYSIKINDREAYSPDSAMAETYSLGKRKQKFGCYLVEVQYPENGQIRFAAVRRNGPAIWANSEAGLLAQLEAE